MQERERRREGDIRGPTRGDFTDWNNRAPTGARPGEDQWTDWDNPEDQWEEAPEGYYDEDDEEWEEFEPDDPDYDLSEAAGYAEWEPRSGSGAFFLPQWVIVAITILLILALLLPALRFFG